MSLEELNILKFGLNHSLASLKLQKTDVFLSFEMIHRFLCEDLKDDAYKPTPKAQLSHLANSYTQLPTIKISFYKTLQFKQTSQ